MELAALLAEAAGAAVHNQAHHLEVLGAAIEGEGMMRHAGNDGNTRG